MPVKPIPIELPLSGGIDTKTDRKLVQLPNFLDLKDVVHSKSGSLQGRKGYTKVSRNISDGTNLENLKKLAARGTELVAIGRSLYSYSENLDTWFDKGSYPQYKLTSEEGPSLYSSQTDVVTAADDNIRVYAWEDSRGGAYYSVKDSSSGSTLLGATLLGSSAAKPQVMATKANVVISWVDTTTSSINLLAINGSNLTGIKTELQLSDLHSDNLYDMAWTDETYTFGGDLVHDGLGLLVYKESTNNKLRAIWLNGQGAVDATEAPLADTTPSAEVVNYISVFPNWYELGEGWSVVFSTASTTEVNVFYIDGTKGTTAEIAASSSIAGTGVSLQSTGSGPDIEYIIEHSAGSITQYYANNTVKAPSSSTAFASGVSLAGHAAPCEVPPTVSEYASADSLTYVVPVSYSSSLQGTIFYLDRSGKVVASMGPGLAEAPTAGYPLARPEFDSSAETITFGLSEKQRLTVDENQTDAYSANNIRLYTLDVSLSAPYDQVVAHDSLYLGGSQLWQYDGNSLVEAGFHIYPELDRTTFAQASATFTNVPNNAFAIDGSSGTLDLVYYALYEWYDNTGRRHQSTAVPITLNNCYDPGSPSESVTFTFPAIPACLTHKSNIRGVVYRTHNDSTAIAYRLDTEVDVSSDSTYTDSTAESALKSGEVLYLSTGALGNAVPYAATKLLSFDDRLFYIRDSEPDKVYFSKRPNTGEGLGFNEGLYIQMPPDGGDTTALATLDNKLVLFKRDRLFMSSGEGPNNLGIGSYSLPRLVSTDTGCKDSRSIVRVPQGVMFQSDKGIYWLNRGEAVSYIGAPVESFNSYTIENSSIIPDDRRVIFLTQDARTLVYDYSKNVWTTFTNHAGLDSVVIDDNYYYLRSTGDVVYKSSSNATDAGTEIVPTVRLPWIHPEGLQKFWHAYKWSLLGNYQSTHDLTIRVMFNYDDDYLAYETTWDPDSALNVGTLGGNATLGGGFALGINTEGQPDTVYQVSQLFKYMRVQSVSLEIRGVAPNTTPGALFELTSLLVMAAGYQDNFKLPGSKEI